MPHCDYCSEHYRGWAIKDGDLNFCSGVCQDRGQQLKLIPAAVIDRKVSEVRAGPCLNCGSRKPVDLYNSYFVWSIPIYARFSTRSQLTCRSCARKRQIGDALASTLLGWCGPGLFVLPFYIIRNLAAAAKSQDKGIPSDELKRRVRRQLLESAQETSQQMYPPVQK